MHPSIAATISPTREVSASFRTACKREQKVLGPWVFCSPEGRFLHNLERDWRPALEAAQIPNFRFHDIRHAFASPP
jgi:integrase